MNDLRYFAYFDMLGFKSAVRRDVDEAWGALSDLRKAMDKNQSYGIKDLNLNKDIVGRVRSEIFSDSILLYSLSNIPEDLISIIMLSAQLYYDSLSLCVPLRGAICFGKFYINPKLHLYCGEPLVDAFILERDLQWSGVVVSEKVVSRFFNTRTGSAFFEGPLITEWDVPAQTPRMKNWVINWPKIFKHAIESNIPMNLAQFYAPFERLFGPFEKLKKHDKVKYVNTVHFINKMLPN